MNVIKYYTHNDLHKDLLTWTRTQHLPRVFRRFLWLSSRVAGTWSRTVSCSAVPRSATRAHSSGRPLWLVGCSSACWYGSAPSGYACLSGARLSQSAGPPWQGALRHTCPSEWGSSSALDPRWRTWVAVTAEDIRESRIFIWKNNSCADSYDNGIG